VPDEPRASLAIPALIAAGVAIVFAIFLGPLLVVVAGAIAVLLGGSAWHDTRTHGRAGEQLAIAAMALGLAAIAISWVVYLTG
jgi:hypothetical protein